MPRRCLEDPRVTRREHGNAPQQKTDPTDPTQLDREGALKLWLSDSVARTTVRSLFLHQRGA